MVDNEDYLRGFVEAAAYMTDEGLIRPPQMLSWLHLYLVEDDERALMQPTLDEMAPHPASRGHAFERLAAAWRAYLEDPGESYPYDPKAETAWQITGGHRRGAGSSRS